METLENDFAKYTQHVLEWLQCEAQKVDAKKQGLTETSERLFHLAVMPFRNLLPKPVGPFHHEDLACKGDHLGRDFRLCAIGVHGAGQHLPHGRHSEINVCSDSLVKSANRFKKNGNSLEDFLLLFNAVYSRFLGRQHTLVHSLLHSTKEEGRIIEMHLSHDGKQDTYTAGELTLIENLSISTLPLVGILKYLCDGDALDKFVSALWHHVPFVSAIRSNNNAEEVIGLYADRVTDLLRSEKDNKQSWYCFSNSFNRNVLRATAFLESRRNMAEILVDSICGRPKARQEHSLSKSIGEAAAMLQMFFLYREICGQWFYVIVPRQQSHLRMCFTVGTTNRLDVAKLKLLTNFGCSVRKKLDFFLDRSHSNETNPQALTGQWTQLGLQIGEKKLSALEKKQLRAPSSDNLVSAALAYYLKFCEKISEVAVHERKKLHFDIVVSDGYFASETLAEVSRLTQERDRPWVVDLLCDNTKTALQPNEVISRLLGNYAFLQQQGMLLFGSRDGHLLYLAKVLEGKLRPEEFTNTGQCYLIQVRERGDVCLFYNGELALWRRDGEYIVPKSYGTTYRRDLTKWLTEHFPTEQSSIDYQILAEAVWSLSSDAKGGATFVLGRMNEGPFPLRADTYELSEVFPYAEGLPLVGRGSLEVLMRLAVQDGGIIIDYQTGQVYGRRQLRPRGIFEWRQYADDWGKKGGQWEWADWHKVLRWGTRHHSALAFSCTVAEGFCGKSKFPIAVITVSSDGDIHVFYGNSPVRELTYPQPAEE